VDYVADYEYGFCTFQLQEKPPAVLRARMESSFHTNHPQVAEYEYGFCTFQLQEKPPAVPRARLERSFHTNHPSIMHYDSVTRRYLTATTNDI
jgi:hypothetical protein